MWQDYVFAIGNMVFIAALLPAVFSKDKPPFTTSAPTALVLFVFAIAYATLHLWFALSTVTFSALCWSVLAVQKYRQNQ